jgi:hypothetical protein
MDPWGKERWEKEGGVDWVLPFEARLAMVKEDWKRAIDYFERYLGGAQGRKAGEALAREYLDLGIAYAEAGLTEGAVRAWNSGLDCGDDRRNGLWKNAIVEARQLFETTGRCWQVLSARLIR